MNKHLQDAIDAINEVRIYWAAKRAIQEPHNQEHRRRFVELINKRSPAQVERMERSRGLAK